MFSIKTVSFVKIEAPDSFNRWGSSGAEREKAKAYGKRLGREAKSLKVAEAWQRHPWKQDEN